MNEKDYYNQSQLWTDVAEYQKNVLEDIRHFIPDDVTSILDVGCGNGFVINNLAGKYDCTGIDISETALAHVTVKKCIGSADELPFPDDSFDLVMINDVLEHLTDSALSKALAELRRVARKYILVTVPFMENLNAGMTCCGNCGTFFHISHHVRSFNLKNLLSLYHGDIRPSVLIYSGSEHDIRDVTQYELRARLHLCTSWKKAMCPVCGANASTSVLDDVSVFPYYNGVANLPADAPFQPPMRNECIAIFRKNASVDILPDSGVGFAMDGKETSCKFGIRDGRQIVHSDSAGEYGALTFASNGILNVYSRPLSVAPGDYLVPSWFNNRIFNASENITDPILLQFLLKRHVDEEKKIALLNELLQEAQAKIAHLNEDLQSRCVKLEGWRGQRIIIENLAKPDVNAKQKDDDKRHFLVICHDQEIDRRIIQQVETLIAAGWSGVIVALSFDAEDKIEEKNGYLIHRIGLKHIVPGCKVYWFYQHVQFLLNKCPISFCLMTRLNLFAYKVLLRLYYRCGPIKYPLPFDLAFYRAAENYQADLILAEDLPALKASALMKRRWGCRLVFDSHEFYPEQKVFSSRQKKIMHGVTRRFIGDCDEVITVSDGIAEKFSEFYGIEKPHVIHNVTMMENTVKGDKFHALLKLDKEDVIILYQGGIIPDRNIDVLLKGFIAASPEKVHLVFLGPAASDFLEKLKRIAGEALGQSVHFLDAVPREELLAYTASADFGVIPYKVIDLNTKYCMPNKFFEFIQAGLPILSNSLIEIKKILDKIGGGGMIHDLNSPKNVAEAIKTMLRRDLKHDHELLLAARQKLSWNTEASEFKNIVKQAMKQ